MKSNESPNQKELHQGLISTPVAIIGMASLFPQARTLPEYWDNILNKIDTIIDVPPSRWKIDEYYDPYPSAADKSYCKRGGFIPEVDFDPAEFGLPPNLLEVTDVSQLLSLVIAKECLEDAGYGEDHKELRERTGVVLGMVGIGSKLAIALMSRLQYPVWDKVLRSYGISAGDSQQIIDKIKLAYPKWEENAFPGSIGNVVAGRIANRLDLGGMNCVVDAACGSSLAALRTAVGELIEGRADMMLTGGVDTDNSAGTYMCFSKTPAFSKSEHVRPFDQESDGMMVGEGIGMVLLKRLADAERDGDRIYAVIKAVGTSSDGRYKSIYAPRPYGQSLALTRAYEEAGYSPTTVGLIEAHGTGTMAGDPAEFEGLNEVFSKDNPRKQTIALGSVKSQIGHTKAAAGVASLIKASLALYQKVLPPTINVTKPNSKFDIENTPFYLNTERRPWIKPARYPRRAGVSSFGFGGTNFHVALEEHEDEHTQSYRLQAAPQVILVAAPTPAELLTRCKDLSAKLGSEQGETTFSELTEATQANAIQQNEARVGFVALNAAEARTQLNTAIDLLNRVGDAESAEHPSGVYYRKNGLDPKGKLVALFPGQGSQYVNMGRDAAINFPPIRQAFAAMDALFEADGKEPLTRAVYPIPTFDNESAERQNQHLTSTEFAQPAIGTFSVGLYRLFQQTGFEASFTAGHSFGELTALYAGGVLDEDGFYTLAKARGQAMAAPDDPSFDAGTMLAVKGDISQLEKELQAFPEIILANQNSNNQVALAGSKTAIAAVQKALTEKGYSVVPLPVSAAFHTPLVAHAQKPFAEAIRQVKFKKPKIGVYSNTSGKKYGSEPDQIRQTLTDHILKPVRFKDEIEAIYAAGGSIFVEFGPKNVLTNLVNNILEGRPHVAIAVNANAKKDSDRQLREAVAQLCVLGLDLRHYDPYALPKKPAGEHKKSSVSVKLDGRLYLTEKTRSAYEAAISAKNVLSQPPNGMQLAGAAVSASVPGMTFPAPTQSASVKNEAAQVAAPETSAVPVDAVLAQIESFQNEALQVHNQFLANDGEYARGFTQLVQQELSLLSSNTSPQAMEQLNQAFQTLERSMDQFHQHQAETLRVHEQYLQSQTELTEQVLQILQAPASRAVSATQPAKPKAVVAISPITPAVSSSAPNHNGHTPLVKPVETQPMAVKKETPVSQPAAVQPSAPIDVEGLKAALLELVSEKTGYPPEMLELGMDMEADLGIDSIKRVEIMGAIQSRFPELPQLDPAALAEMRTLGNVADYVSAATKTQAAPGTKPQQPTVAPATAQPAPAGQTAAIAVSKDEVTRAFLEIVSEKTGFPTDMFELGMDMEADLGIDSIKRVEILGAVQARFPSLPQIDPAALAEMRTLGQVVDYITATPQQPTAVAETTVKAAETSSPVQPAVTETAGKATDTPVPAQPTTSVKEITQAFLKVVSEKTGYPVEMLELDMELEADLGIDSIKRVEILGAMQAGYPELAQIDPARLAELRTLKQIIESLAAPTTGTVPAPQPSSSAPEAAEEKTVELPRGVVMLKSVPEPDHLEVSVAKGHICLVMDDGTDLTLALVKKLGQEGKDVVVLRLPETLAAQRPLPAKVHSAQLPDGSEAGIQGTLDALQKKYGPVAVFIHLDLTAGASDDNSEREESIVETVFLIAKLLKASLNTAAQDGFAAFMTVTHLDGEIGLASSGSVEPLSGAFFGLVKTLNL
ncbi:MAG TPA: beta-ketoacyl synthase N-terminal-like domain-containing protein, partial [Longilinea sp.]|nr:beta-ketoacyl synthase N-terminal-like domain-containing protein [Longilinea sp.]